MHSSLIASGRQPEACQSFSSTHQPADANPVVDRQDPFRLLHHGSLLYVASCRALKTAALIRRHRIDWTIDTLHSQCIAQSSFVNGSCTATNHPRVGFSLLASGKPSIFPRWIELRRYQSWVA
jgi:hypothetical protein